MRFGCYASWGRTAIRLLPQTEDPPGPQSLVSLVTDGMREHYGLFELELRNVPPIFIQSGAGILNNIAFHQIVTGVPVRPGSRGPSPTAGVTLKFKPSSTSDLRAPCLEVCVDEVHLICPGCGGPIGACDAPDDA